MSRLGKQRIGRALVAAALVVSVSVRAQEPSLGVVQQSNRGYIKQSPVSDGATVFSGEELSTDVGGVLAVAVGGTGFRLLESTRAFIYHGVAGPLAELNQGTLVFHKEAGGQNLSIVASDIRIMSKGDGAATGQVLIASPCEVRVTSVVGQLEVVAGSETRTIGDRETYSVTPDNAIVDVRSPVSPDDPAYHGSHTHKSCAAEQKKKFGGPPVGSGSSHFLKIALIAGGIGVLIAVLPKSHSVSPSQP